tara:strand:+ start:42 stop:845 length:804 start_codon:yes stop_codon:yes gene_type:complete
MADDVYRLMQQLQRPDVGSIQPVTDPRTQRVESIANMLQVLGLARTPRDAFRMANKHENFKSTVGEFLPGESYKLAQERGDKLGQGLAMIDMIPGAGLLTGPAKLAKKALPTPKVDTSYRMQHQARGREWDDAIQLDDLTKDISGNRAGYPDDFYSPKGQRIYAPGKRFADDEYGIANTESYNAILKAKNNPEAEITIYRAVPKGIKNMNEGDFVTLSPKYAELHASSGYGQRGDEAGEVIAKKVKVKDLIWDATDVNEFGYFPIKD